MPMKRRLVSVIRRRGFGRLLAIPAVACLAVAAVPALIPSSVAEEYPAIGPLPAKDAPDPGKVEMGRRLFFDVRLSGDGAISCAACHDPEQGFTYLGADGVGAVPNGGVGGAGARPEGGAPVAAEPGEGALWGTPGDLGAVRRELVEIGGDAADLAAGFDERLRAEADRGRRAAGIVYAGLLAVVLGVVLWVFRPRWARGG